MHSSPTHEDYTCFNMDTDQENSSNTLAIVPSEILHTEPFTCSQNKLWSSNCAITEIGLIRKKIVSSSTEVRYQGTSASRLNNLESFSALYSAFLEHVDNFFLFLIHESPIKHVLSRVLYTTTSNNVWNNNSLKNPRSPRILLMHMYIYSLKEALNFVSTLNK